MREWSFGSPAVTLSTAAQSLNILWPGASPTTAPAGLNIEFLRHWVGQTGTTTSAQQPVALSSWLSPSGGTGFTSTYSPVQLKWGDPSTCTLTKASTLAQGKCATGNASTTESTSGTVTDLWRDAFNVLNGYLKVNTPAEDEIFIAGATVYARFWFPAAPTSTASWCWGESFREV